MYTGLVDFNLKKDVNTIRPTGLFPESIDWRQKGAVAAVENQASCGSCYAFSAVTGLESLHFNKKGQLVKFSEQQLVDCSGDYGNQGCNGGWMHWCYDYIAANGITTAAKYPYVGYEQSCNYAPEMEAFRNAGYAFVSTLSKNAMKEAVSK